MKPFVTYMTIGFFLVSLQGEAQKNTLKVTKINTEQRYFRKILIVGTGSIETHAFLEMLSSNLISTLKAHKIEGLFYFFKEDTSGGNREMAKPLPDSFEAILVFKPLEDSHYSLVTVKRDNSWLKPYLGQPVESRYKRKIDYKERFDIQLFAQPNKSDTIWSATLGVHCNFSKKPNINEIAEKIISGLQSGKVLMR